ncbi:MAG TPA: tetratricopeptide repeat protein [Candidatus Elarobacter sp.]
MGLPPRLAIPILVVFAVLFLGVTGYFLAVGLGTTGSAFGPNGQVAQQGDANIRTTPAPIATDPPGTFTVPQTGTGPIGGGGTALPGQQVGGGTPAGPPAPVMAQLQQLRGRLDRNPKDLAALVQLGNMEFDAQKFDKAHAYYTRALALDPTNPDVRTDDAVALHQTGRDIDALAELDRVLKERPKFPAAVFNRGAVLQAVGRRTDAVAAFKQYLAIAGPNDPRAADARAALQQLGSQ